MKGVLIYSVLFGVLLVLSINGVSAQSSLPDADKVLKTSLAKLKKSAYQSNFSLVYYNAESDKSDVQMGKCTMQGRKFNLNISAIETIFDGKTQWVYVAADNEVSITEPSDEELRESNPMVMMEHNLATHRINHAESRDADYYVVNLFPTENIKDGEYFKITISIHKTTYLPKQLTIWQRNGDKISFNWENMYTITPKSNTFSFIKSDYPNLIVNDLR